MRSVGDSFDAQIVDGLRRGLSVRQIAREIEPCAIIVRRRAYALGLREVAIRNGRQATRRNGHFSSIHFDMIRDVRSDPAAARLSRTVRYARPYDRDVNVDPDHIVACLHEGGLTLPEIEAATGVPPRVAVAAIRQFAEARA